MPDATVRDAAPPERDRAIIPDATLLDAAPEDRGGRDLGDRPGAFRIDRIVPGSGPPDRNVDVVINGQGFPFGEDITARLGDTRLLEATVRGEGTITAIVPAGIAPGLYSLSVIRADGQEAILPSAYTVLDAGELALVSVRPTDIVEGRIATLDLVGAGFDDTTQFFVDTVELTDPIISSSTEATATLSAPLVAGEYDVLAVRGEHSAILRGGLTVRRPSRAVSDDCGCRVGRNADAPMAIWGLLGLLLWRRRRCA
jgi:MYXO-CTERM domain-containing protein